MPCAAGARHLAAISLSSLAFSRGEGGDCFLVQQARAVCPPFISPVGVFVPWRRGRPVIGRVLAALLVRRAAGLRCLRPWCLPPLCRARVQTYSF